MNFQRAVLLLMPAFAFASFAQAWDGRRKGLRLGFGGGTQSDAYYYEKEEGFETSIRSVNDISPAITSRLGYGFTDTWALDFFGLNSMKFPGIVKYTALNVAWWNSPQAPANSYFGGFGYCSESFRISEYGYKPAPSNDGFGFNFGFAREFAPHVSAEIALMVSVLTDYRYSKDEAGKWVKSADTPQYGFASIGFTLHILGY